jgi:hypothetical protein
MYWCKNWPLLKWKDKKWGYLRRKVPVRIFGPKRGNNVWNMKTVKMELHDLIT